MTSSLTRRIADIRMLRPLRSRDFKLLFTGQSVSLFGDQFYLVAIPLLTLDLTGSAVALGTVLMVGGVSRALFDLVGGALTDRMSQRSILLISNLVRAAVSATITLIAFSNVARLWHLYLFSVVFGIVDAFFFPAFLSVIPRLVEKELLNAGNALMRGSARLMSGIGPAAAGLLIIWLTSRAGDATGSRRFASAFAIDAATFIFAALTVWLMSKRRFEEPDGQYADAAADGRGLGGLLRSIRDGLAYSLRDPLIRALLLFTAALEFSFIGTSTVGLAMLAKTRFVTDGGSAEGAGPFAAMLSAFGFGMLAGMIVAGSMKTPRRRGRLVAWTMLLLGLGLAALGFISNVWGACAIVIVIGFGAGLSNILLLSWLQVRSEPRMLGRVLSLAMFGTSVVEPLSYAMAGIIADVSVTALFVISGAVMLIASAASILHKVIITSD